MSGIAILILFGLISYNHFRARARSRLQDAVIEEQKKGLEAVFTATEEERKRIAKDLHDGIGQRLSALKMGFQQLMDEVNSDQNPRSGKLKELISDTANETREISHQMMPRALTELGLVPAVQDALLKTLGSTDIKYTFEQFNLRDSYGEQKEVALFRILQELINNLIKHSGATKAAVQLFESKNQLILVVEDDGTGVAKENREGHGLLNIKNRLSTFDGKVNLESVIDGGTTARIIIPV